VRRALARVGWALALGNAATALWLLLSPATELWAKGALAELALRRRTPDELMARMWRLQLPGTALAACCFSLIVLRRYAVGLLKWGRGAEYGAAIGGSLALVLFASPPPGLPLSVWGATFFLTGLFTASLLAALPGDGATFWIGDLLAVWPAVATALLASLFILVGGWLGEWVFPVFRRPLWRNKL
jgi:hypothetical protein